MPTTVIITTTTTTTTTIIIIRCKLRVNKLSIVKLSTTKKQSRKMH